MKKKLKNYKKAVKNTPQRSLFCPKAPPIWLSPASLAPVGQSARGSYRVPWQPSRNSTKKHEVTRNGEAKQKTRVSHLVSGRIPSVSCRDVVLIFFGVHVRTNLIICYVYLSTGVNVTTDWHCDIAFEITNLSICMAEIRSGGIVDICQKCIE